MLSRTTRGEAIQQDSKEKKQPLSFAADVIVLLLSQGGKRCVHTDAFFFPWQHPPRSLSNVRYVKAHRGTSVSNPRPPVTGKGTPCSGPLQEPVDARWTFLLQRRIHHRIHRAGTATFFRQVGMSKYDTSPIARSPSHAAAVCAARAAAVACDVCPRPPSPVQRGRPAGCPGARFAASGPALHAWV
ncbi:hypothetical protein M433DRAFT_417369 [Acidomyces richmondensis BFW]|nr:hypothetical protein M433DRAFT_417369 [Acidomyces richmondensis BFW]